MWLIARTWTMLTSFAQHQKNLVSSVNNVAKHVSLQLASCQILLCTCADAVTRTSKDQGGMQFFSEVDDNPVLSACQPASSCLCMQCLNSSEAL